MNWFRKLPQFQRSPPGLEVDMFRALPQALLWGTALPLLAGFIVKATPVGIVLFKTERWSQVMIYQLIGFVLVYWTAVGTVGIGCILVKIMKGPAYIADDFPGAAGTQSATPSRDRSP
jgi:mannose/fructose/N-acetylgalactosamine-specific phosphotransferase system component IIC